MPELDEDQIAKDVRTLKAEVETRHQGLATNPGFLGLVALLNRHDHARAHDVKTAKLAKLLADAAALEGEVEEHAQGAGLVKPRRGRHRRAA